MSRQNRVTERKQGNKRRRQKTKQLIKAAAFKPKAIPALPAPKPNRLIRQLENARARGELPRWEF